MIIAARLGLPATGTLSAVAILSIVSRPGRGFGASMREMLARIIPAARASSPLLHLDFILRSFAFFEVKALLLWFRSYRTPSSLRLIIAAAMWGRSMT
jgi:hypothetical protein